MVWVNAPGLPGKVYVPDDTDRMQKKHPCKSCFSCQWCDENRCQVCRNETTEAVEPAPCRHRSPAAPV